MWLCYCPMNSILYNPVYYLLSTSMLNWCTNAFINAVFFLWILLLRTSCGLTWGQLDRVSDELKMLSSDNNLSSEQQWLRYMLLYDVIRPKSIHEKSWILATCFIPRSEYQGIYVTNSVLLEVKFPWKFCIAVILLLPAKKSILC